MMVGAAFAAANAGKRRIHCTINLQSECETAT
jgi:hypothetical protein